MNGKHEDKRCEMTRRSAAFTIIEIMIVVAIIGTLAIIAIPSFVNARNTSQNASFLNSLRLISQELELYSLQEGKGDFPPDAPVGTVPPGFESYIIRGHSWSDTTPIGGQWDWDRAPDRTLKVHGVYAGISIINPGRTSTQMQEIDKKVDDGILTDGKFRQHAAGYIYAVEE